jgi:hypothetical protein
LQNIRQLHRDAVTGLQAGLILQVSCEGGALLIQFGIGQGLSQTGKSRAISKTFYETIKDFD